MMVRFATTCDTCGARSVEYTAWPSCRNCGTHHCPTCEGPGTRSEEDAGEPVVCYCRTCLQTYPPIVASLYAVRAELQRMARECPERFDYRSVDYRPDAPCGCVIPVIRRVLGIAPEALRSLRLSPAQEAYLIGIAEGDDATRVGDLRACHVHDMSEWAATGRRLVAVVIHRIDTILEHYT